MYSDALNQARPRSRDTQGCTDSAAKANTSRNSPRKTAVGDQQQEKDNAACPQLRRQATQCKRATGAPTKRRHAVRRTFAAANDSNDHAKKPEVSTPLRQRHESNASRAPQTPQGKRRRTRPTSAPRAIPPSMSARVRIHHQTQRRGQARQPDSGPYVQKRPSSQQAPAPEDFDAGHAPGLQDSGWRPTAPVALSG